MGTADSVGHEIARGGFVRGLFRTVLLLAVFAAGVGIGYSIWDSIRLPFHNPLNVVGPLANRGVNPANNLVRFFVFVGLPAALLAALAAVRFGPINNILFGDRAAPGQSLETDSPRTIRFALIAALLAFAALVSLSVPTYHASGAFDTFHEGESLGTAVSLDHGMAPYRDFIFLHGFYQDPYRSHLAFRLFGRSIGASRTLESLTKVASWILLAAVVLLLFEKDILLAVPAFLALALMQREFSVFFYRHLIDKSFVCDPRVLIILPPRDVVLFIFLLCAIGLDRLGKRGNGNPYAAGAIGFAFAFVPVGAFGYSVDRGLYLSVAFALAATTLYWLHFRRGKSGWVFPLSCGLGIVSAVSILWWMLRGQLGGFFDFVFLAIPRYKELSDGHEYTISFLPNLRVALVYGAVTLWVVYQFIHRVYWARGLWKGVDVFLRNYFVETLLLAVAGLYFRSALGRTDWEHIAYSSIPVYLLAFLIAGKHVCRPWLGGKRGMWTRYVVLGAMIAGCAILLDDARRSRLMDSNFPYRTADEKFLTQPYRDAIAYLKANLRPEEKVYTLTSEASWFYFLDRPAPTRFPVVWFATPDPFQEEVVRDLQGGNVKYIIYRSDYPHIDDISHEERYPIIMDFLKGRFRPDRAFGRVEIWVRDG